MCGAGRELGRSFMGAEFIEKIVGTNISTAILISTSTGGSAFRS